MHETNHAAISRYRKSGYREFGRHAAYYEDGGDALRFEKQLVPAGLRVAVMQMRTGFSVRDCSPLTPVDELVLMSA